MVEISTVYQGKLRCRSTHEPSGVELITDAPKDNMGEGASFSPTDLVATALGTCMMTVMGIVAQRENLDLTGTTVKVKKEMATQPTRRIGRVQVDFEVPTAMTDVQKQKLINAAETCPVHKSLHPDVQVDVKFNFTALVPA
ncbi:MAG TPA: OsmC family protein [Oculatellaceae cyanobacterium]